MQTQTGSVGTELKLNSKAAGGHDEFKGIWLEGGGSRRVGIVLLHGRNGHPDGAVVGGLRRSLNALGYSTLSIQNPIPRKGDEFPFYVEDIKGEQYVFPEAYARIKTAIGALHERGVKEVVLLGFSMGARMHSAFLAQGEATQVPVRALIAISNGVNGIPPLNAASSLGKVSVPVMDIFGDADKDVAGSIDQRKSAYEAGRGESFTEFAITGGAPHNFAGFEIQLEQVVHRWIKSIAPAA